MLRDEVHDEQFSVFQREYFDPLLSNAFAQFCKKSLSPDIVGKVLATYREETAILLFLLVRELRSY